MVIVPMGRKDTRHGTFRSIAEQAGLTGDDFRHGRAKSRGYDERPLLHQLVSRTSCHVVPEAWQSGSAQSRFP
jgi:hypothetical protein